MEESYCHHFARKVEEHTRYGVKGVLYNLELYGITSDPLSSYAIIILSLFLRS